MSRCEVVNCSQLPPEVTECRVSRAGGQGSGEVTAPGQMSGEGNLGFQIRSLLVQIVCESDKCRRYM